MVNIHDELIKLNDKIDQYRYKLNAMTHMNDVCAEVAILLFSADVVNFLHKNNIKIVNVGTTGIDIWVTLAKIDTVTKYMLLGNYNVRLEIVINKYLGVEFERIETIKMILGNS